MMKKTFFILSFCVLTSFSDSQVYICVSPGAKKYHYTKSCRGLSNCKHEIKKTTRLDATNKGLELCGWED